ncbi:hypothetical protein [Commensalibacter papalotli (ex Botero et al. 2024)]|uniref:Uncharacterized protein n=1 Tax=Commensalibacter papalotli (ex Botero et al. 2024) TaxID=2972766 RepID=A0ABN8W1R6_9PROT|nr:hypothetical protein [Commensalibacter papalotli (ex Botero et al. 2024)]CAI3924052.1 unnamed protein product [Commensalibacter papalotli (ex Botero et al. 2024)]CAI3928042.1 unnamed protein product [Commensalibacter papalotli (ex Botero et al. 2024)]
MTPSDICSIILLILLFFGPCILTISLLYKSILNIFFEETDSKTEKIIPFLVLANLLIFKDTSFAGIMLGIGIFFPVLLLISICNHLLIIEKTIAVIWLSYIITTIVYNLYIFHLKFDL